MEVLARPMTWRTSSHAAYLLQRTYAIRLLHHPYSHFSLCGLYIQFVCVSEQVDCQGGCGGSESDECQDLRHTRAINGVELGVCDCDGQCDADPANDVGRPRDPAAGGPIPGYSGDLIQLCRREGDDCRTSSGNPWLLANPQEWTQVVSNAMLVVLDCHRLLYSASQGSSR